MNKRTLALAGATVLCAGGVAFAATASASNHGTNPASSSRSSQASSNSASSKGDPGLEDHPGLEDVTGAYGTEGSGGSEHAERPGKAGRNLSDLPRMLHGEQVIRNPKTGKLITCVEQRGKITAVSGSTVTVRSADGTSWAWKLTKDTSLTTKKSGAAEASALKKGDSVLVAGVRNGDTRTARALSDPPRALADDLVKKLRKRLGRHLDHQKLDELRKRFREELGDALPERNHGHHGHHGHHGLSDLLDLLGGVPSSSGSDAATGAQAGV